MKEAVEWDCGVMPQRGEVQLCMIFLMHEYRSSTRCETWTYLVATLEGDTARRVGLATFYKGEYKQPPAYRNTKTIKLV